MGVCLCGPVIDPAAGRPGYLTRHHDDVVDLGTVSAPSGRRGQGSDPGCHGLRISLTVLRPAELTPGRSHARRSHGPPASPVPLLAANHGLPCGPSPVEANHGR